MKLEDLKKKATTSEMALIDTVEKLVRGEYDKNLMEKEIHRKLKEDIYHSVEVVMRRHKILSSQEHNPYSPYRNGIHFGEYDRLKDILFDIGDAIRLELTNDGDYE